ncbi:MAG: carbohydrate ABC transporter substrate-binding protein, partial [Desulfobacteraceae bacterium]|nr:carbohydrate ABC transporter substrate-binding protein [Desulfobacteraceae bacterium]
MRIKKILWVILALLVIMALSLTACQPEEVPTEVPEEAAPEEPEEAAPAEEIDCFGGEGSEISLLAVWAGDEEARLIEIFQPLIDACDITFTYEGTRDLSAILSTRVEGGIPPDVTMMPSVGSLTQYKDDLVPLADLGANLDNYAASWLALGTVDGEVLGVFVKSDIKSIIWYSPLVFETEGYTVPTTWDEFVALIDQISTDGGVPLSMGMESGGATGWTGTDFVQDVMLRTQGLDFVNGLTLHDTAWNDPGVAEAWELYGSWA